MSRHLESRLQRSCITWFRYQHPGLARLIFAVPNGGFRSSTEAAIMKGEGVVPGVSDVILLKSNHQYSALCIEFKTPEGKQTDSQQSWQDLVEQYGNKYVICRSFEEFRDQVNLYLGVKRG